jgi:hypothetical protein
LAYSLNDVYQSLRTAMRLNGSTVGVGLGLLLLLFPRLLMPAELAREVGLFWPYRLGGAVLIAVGLHLLFAAGERMVRASTMLLMLVTNALIAVVLLLAFLQRELVDLSPIGQVILGGIFFLCVVGAGFALRYLREDYNMV